MPRYRIDFTVKGSYCLEADTREEAEDQFSTIDAKQVMRDAEWDFNAEEDE